jgi:hypothetical protein
MNVKDRRRRPEEEGVNESKSKFLRQLSIYPKIDPMPLSSNPAKIFYL